MQITRISHLKDFGIFREFVWPSGTPDFGRYNLIYGWNGSGKTTLSRLFRALEARKAPHRGKVVVSIDGRDVRGDEFAQTTLPVRVFNRDFVTENIFPVGGGDVPPIFVIGRDSVQKQQEVERFKRDLIHAQTALESARQKKQEAEKLLDDYCVNSARTVKDTLRSPGSNRYNNYNKSDFRRRAQEMAASGDGEAHRVDVSSRDKLLAQHRASLKDKVPEVTYQLPNLRQLAVATAKLLSTTVVSSVIESLKDDRTLSVWVHQGLDLHKVRGAENCLFCGQTLPKDRLATIEAHFNNEYEQLQKKLDAQIAELRAKSEVVATVKLPNRAELYEDLAEEYDSAEASLRRALDSTRTILDSLAQVLTEKKSNAFERLSLDVSTLEVRAINRDASGMVEAAATAIADWSPLDSDVVGRLNEVIRKHNRSCEEFEDRVREARTALENALVADALDEFVQRATADQGAEAKLTEASQQVERLQLAVRQLEREIVEHRQPAEELNEDLRKYLGHDEVRLDIKDTGYAITRNGEAAYALSEGEMTAIALLYFLKSLSDQRFDLSSGVVVLDDPVSSLDANALYLAFGFIRHRTRQAAQLFILTHNFTFFRQVVNWFKSQDKKEKITQFYMLDSICAQGRRQAAIRPLHPLLKEYDSEYHYLFFRIYHEARRSTLSSLEENYIFPNMARRLLEAFLAFRQPHLANKLWRQLQAVPFDEARKLRIYRFVNAHSHSGAIVEPEHDPSLLGETRSVLADLLDFIQSVDADHFSAMQKVVDTVSASAADEGEDE